MRSPVALASGTPSDFCPLVSAALAIAIITSSGFDQTHEQAQGCFGDKATDDPNNADAGCAQRGQSMRRSERVDCHIDRVSPRHLALAALLNEDKEAQDTTKVGAQTCGKRGLEADGIVPALVLLYRLALRHCRDHTCQVYRSGSIELDQRDR